LICFWSTLFALVSFILWWFFFQVHEKLRLWHFWRGEWN
jgi:hypothetical protein